MNFKEYVDGLVKILEDNPELASSTPVYAADDEGNGFQAVGFGATTGNFDGDYRGEFISAADLASDEEYEDLAINAVCVN